jgi:mannose-1-phosphate guanylyltransferase
MSHVSLSEFVEELDDGESHYLDVLDEDSMRVEIARYPNPAPKYPHDEDELYYILSGSGTARVGDEEYALGEGDLLYVERGREHAFVDIEAELTALIVFAGAEENVLGRT